MYSYFSPVILKALGADKIIDNGSGTLYVCTKDDSKIQMVNGTRATDAEVETQEVWQIKQVAETTDASGNTVTTIKYPYGRTTFSFSVDQISSYNFEYRR